MLSLPIPYATTLARHTGPIRSLMSCYLTGYEFLSTNAQLARIFATSPLEVSLAVRFCGLWAVTEQPLSF